MGWEGKEDREQSTETGDWMFDLCVLLFLFTQDELFRKPHSEESHIPQHYSTYEWGIVVPTLVWEIACHDLFTLNSVLGTECGKQTDCACICVQILCKHEYITENN